MEPVAPSSNLPLSSRKSIFIKQFVFWYIDNPSFIMSNYFNCLIRISLCIYLYVKSSCNLKFFYLFYLFFLKHIFKQLIRNLLHFLHTYPNYIMLQILEMQNIYHKSEVKNFIQNLCSISWTSISRELVYNKSLTNYNSLNIFNWIFIIFSI